MAKERSKIVVGIVIGIFIVLALFIIGKMAYDSGYAAGKGEGVFKISSCLSQCSYKVNQTTSQYRQGCVDVCIAKGGNSGDYYDYYRPFPF